MYVFFFFSSRRRHTRCSRDWSSDVCSSDLDWLCEAALDTYLPLLERLTELAAEGTAAPVTIGFTPVLANQLASPAFAREMDAFFAQRLTACDEAAASLASGGDAALLPLVEFWRARLNRLQALFRSIDRDLISAFRRLEEQGRLEIIGSAATHGDRKSTRLNSSHGYISYAVFCLKKKKK